MGVERRVWPRDPRYLVGTDGAILDPTGQVVAGTPGKWGHLHLLGTTAGAIVCETFHGPRPLGMQAAHENGQPGACGVGCGGGGRIRCCAAKTTSSHGHPRLRMIILT